MLSNNRDDITQKTCKPFTLERFRISLNCDKFNLNAKIHFISFDLISVWKVFRHQNYCPLSIRHSIHANELISHFSRSSSSSSSSPPPVVHSPLSERVSVCFYIVVIHFTLYPHEARIYTMYTLYLYFTLDSFGFRSFVDFIAPYHRCTVRCSGEKKLWPHNTRNNTR